MLALTLATLAYETRRHQALGYITDIATVSRFCGESELTIVTALGHQEASINSKIQVHIPDLRARLHEILKYQAEILVYVRADPGATVEDFVQLLAAVQPEADIVSLLTPRVDALRYHGYCLAPSCRSCDNFPSPRRERTQH